MWLSLTIATVVILGTFGLLISKRGWDEGRPDLDESLRRWRDAAEHERASILHSEMDPHEPNPTAWYLLGFDRLRRGLIADAARAFGMAYHQDVSIESAALLTFACLKVKTNLPYDLLDQIAVTWHEMRRPPLDESTRDRTLIHSLLEQENNIPTALTALGRIAWLAAGSDGRGELGKGKSSARRSWNDFYRS